MKIKTRAGTVELCPTCGKTFSPIKDAARYEQHLLKHWLGQPLEIELLDQSGSEPRRHDGRHGAEENA